MAGTKTPFCTFDRLSEQLSEMSNNTLTPDAATEASRNLLGFMRLLVEIHNETQGCDDETERVGSKSEVYQTP